MSLCSASEIAEKKRIALEKLKLKKYQLAANITNCKIPLSVENRTCKDVVDNAANSLQNIGTSANEGSSFPSALKVTNVLVQRQVQHSASETVHPYKKPSDANKFFKRSSNGHADKLKAILSNTTDSVACKSFPVLATSVSCKVAMISPARFKVQPSSYHAKLIDVFKSIPSRAYDTRTRYWSFGLSDYNTLQDRINILKPDVVVGVLPKSVLNLCQRPPTIINKSCLESIDPVLIEKLLPFQQDGVCFAIAQHGRCMICDEMGLGKTYQAIAVADFYRDNWPLFICTTASTRDSWIQHVRELLPSIPLHYIQVLDSNQQYIADCKVLITSYSMMERNINNIIEHKFGFLIFDESHTLKNSKAKCTIVADRLSQQAQRILLLSGTPALSRPLELFSQLQMVDRKFMGFIEFTSRYCDGKQTNFGWDASGQSNLDELNVVLRHKYMIRRTKSEVFKSLPEKFRETVVLDPDLIWPSDDVKEYLNIVAKNLHSCKSTEKEKILLKFYAQTAEVKTKAVCAYLEKLVKESKKFIVFAHHRIMIDAICDCVSKLEVKYIRIDGGTRKLERGKLIDIYQNNSSYKVAVLSLGACNSGITLTAANLVIFAELTWNPSTLAQAESRAHRIGQTKPVTCRYLMATKTADDHIWNMLKNKQDTLNKAGIFCENLQHSTHTTASISSNIENYFISPKIETNQNAMIKKDTESNETLLETQTNLNKEVENIDNFFQDDDDAFRDIIY